ncbi:MAG: DUF4212 domain-containing protein [Candidatus Hinthialibacter antarcticus]|nr:DUF4212 domain-containing protein [Candidatus Hinthialibacter antarcticus]
MSQQPTQNAGREASEHDVNFFFPKTDHSRANMRMVVIMVVVWAVAVFGFQFLLIAMNQPTPEPSYTAFETVWPNIENASASQSEKQDFAKAALSALGKNIALKPDHKEVLQDSVSKIVLSLIAADQKAGYLANLANPDTKPQAVALAVQAIGLESTGFDSLRADFLAFALAPTEEGAVSSQVPEIMELYLIHNQSALTDFRFLGFPFHYWYTAQFLLILFVVLCLIFATITDRLNTKYNFEDE